MRLSLILCQTLLILFTLGCAGKPSSDPMVIGLLAPLSGPAQDVGKSMEQGVLLAVEETKENPIHGRAVEALMVDTAGSADTAFHQAVRLVTINRVVALVGGHDAASAEKLCRVGETYQLPAITLAWLPARGLGPFGFSVGPAAAERGKALAKFGTMPAERVAVLTDSRDPAATALSAAYVSQAKDVVYQSVLDDDRAAEIVRQALANKPQAALLAGPASQLAWWQLELRVPILFGGAGDPPETEQEGIVVWTAAYVATEPAGKAFAVRFEKKFGKPPDAAAALAYDAVRLWIESARKAEGSKVKDELAQWSDFPSVTGPLGINAEHAARRLVYVLRRQKGATRVVGTWDEPAAPSQR